MIKGLQRSVAEGGKIKIGGKGKARPTGDGKGTWAPPRKDDHFTVTTNLRERGDPNANLIVNAPIMKSLVEQGWADDDGKVRRLPVAVFHDDVDQVFPTALVAYAGRKMACRGDGEKALRYLDPATGAALPEPAEIPCPCERHEKDDEGARRCKFNGILHCSLRLPGHAVIGSVYRLRTTSQITVEQMTTHLMDILSAAGTLRGLPLMLVMRPQQVSPGGRPSTVYVCHIDLCEDLVIAQRAALEAATMRRQLAGSLFDAHEADYRPTLQLPGAESPEEQPEIAGEYYPDEVVGSTPAGAEVQAAATQAPPEVLANPLGGLLRPSEPHPILPGIPPAKPAAPAPEPERKPRKTRCTVCGDLFERGIVKGGMCTECAKPQEPPQPDPAPEIGSGPPTAPSPYVRVQAAVTAAVQRTGNQDATFKALDAALPGCAAWGLEEWTDERAAIAEKALGELR